ncbi:MAG: dihydroorotase [Lysobacterales bacterium]|nr:MAG: dihydroorotase [Xanthomonadales bacterium]
MSLIRGAWLCNEGERFFGDLRIREGRIARIAPRIEPLPGETVFEAEGRWLLPGMIDDQVHFREPGLTHKGDLESESRAAVAGGITSFLEMPNTKPPTLDRAALLDKYRRAEGRCHANYGFYIGAANDNLSELLAVDPLLACGVKIFMGASTGNMLVDDPEVLDAIFAKVRLRLITHCEETPRIEANLARLKALHPAGLRPEHHPLVRDRLACLASTEKAIALAKRHDARLHVLHISTADELALFEPGPIEGKRITAETCVHFLHFDESDYPRLGNLIKCNPSIKSASDREALLKALADRRLDVLATDHAPHTLEEKQQPYEQAPSGLPLVQHALPAALEPVFSGRISLERVVELTAHAPARLFQIEERGFLREGYFADLVLIDPEKPTEVRREALLYRCGWSPFEGRRFRSSVAATWVNGQLVFDGRKVREEPAGRRLRWRHRPS